MDLTGYVSSCATDCLNEAGLRPQETFLVRIEDGNQGYLGEVETLTQQVDADQDIEYTHPKLTKQFNASQRVDIGVEVLNLHSVLE